MTPPRSGTSNASFHVHGTKKGAIPVSVERRALGKKVTVIENVSGDADALLRMLKSRLGTGGTRRGSTSTVEIAGDRVDAVSHLLASVDGCLKGVAGLGNSAQQKRRKKAQQQSERRNAEETAARVAIQQKDERHKPKPVVSRARRKIVTLSQPHASCETFDGFKALMMTRWPYWDKDFSRLREYFHRRRREREDVGGFTETLTSGDDEAPRLECADESSAHIVDVHAALSELHMIATPSEFRLSRMERMRRAKKRMDSTTSAPSSASTRAMETVTRMDPFAEYLDNHGFRAAEKRDSTARPSAPPARTQTRSSRKTKKGKPTGASFVSTRKMSTKVREEEYLSSDDAPAWKRDGFDVGFSPANDADGSFGFGGEITRRTESQSSTLLSPDDADEDEDEDEDLAKALRESSLTFASEQEARRMHVECDELFPGFTEDDILAYVMAMTNREEEPAPAIEESMPSKSDWMSARLRELFYPNVELARELLPLVRAVESRDAVLDVLEGAGARPEDALAFARAFEALTLEDDAYEEVENTADYEWANETLASFTGETDNAFLIEYFLGDGDFQSPADVFDFLASAIDETSRLEPAIRRFADELFRRFK